MPRLGLKNGFWERSFFERGVQVPRENKEYERSHKNIVNVSTEANHTRKAGHTREEIPTHMNNLDNKLTIDELLHRGLRYRDSKEFVKFFDFIARFKHYSRYNTMLVYIQNPAVTFFGGVSYWRNEFGRNVKEDARPYIILAPMCPVMLVYDVFDTVGYHSPEEFIKKGLGRDPHAVKGEISLKTYEYAIEEAKNWGIKVSYKPLNYFRGGYVTTIKAGHLEICLKAEASLEENFAVLIHELAHLLLGHTGHKKIQNEKKGKQKILMQRYLARTTAELEAETVSYLVCHKLNLQTQAAEYLAGYMDGEEDLLSFSYETVVKVTDRIESLFIKQEFVED